MKREITTYEVRSFFAAANKQFEEAGFYLNDVHFNRDEDGCLQGIKLNYTEKNTPNDKHVPTTGKESAGNCKTSC